MKLSGRSHRSLSTKRTHVEQALSLGLRGGLLTISSEYTILISPELTAPYNTTGTLDTLDGRSRHLPDEDALRPDQAYLSWHRKTRFRD